MKILVIHGPNLHLLGSREVDIYGDFDLASIDSMLEEKAVVAGYELITMQTNHEGEIVDKIGACLKDGIDFIIINPAALTHSSVAIRDAIEAVKIPVIEVHLSNIYSREAFRHQSLIAPVVIGQMSGFGYASYLLALEYVIQYFKKQKES